ncbi:MFS transporter [Xylanibacter ruminicola]|nr:MFS transporter [Xylanibacter ruminicola]GJG34044.1 MFS transporter [Xylanibacter ruminicola]SEH64455.1 Predicted arabinose efflux permease, MFS family [Xylanibacter ruminicola]
MDKLWNRNYCKVMAANFTLFFAFYVLTPLLPLYLSEHFGATKDVIGLVLSGYTITALLFRPFSGYVVDSFPRKMVLMVSFSVFAIFFAGYLAASTLLLFTIVRTLHGGPFGALTVANSTVAIDVLPSSRRTEGIGYYGLSNNLAMAIAPTIGIFIYQLTNSFEFLFWLALIVATTGWLIDSTVKLKPRDSSQARSSRLSLDRFFLTRGWLLGLNMVAFGFSFGVLSNYLAIYGKEVMGITGGTGTYFMLCSVGLILSRLQGSKALRDGRVTHNAATGMVISLVGYTLFILMPTLAQSSMVNGQCSMVNGQCSMVNGQWSMFNGQWSMFIGYYGSALLIGLGNGHMWPAFQNMTINVATNKQRGTANSTILISWDIGMGLGILAGGIVAELISYSAAFWTVVLVNGTGVATYFLATRAFFLRRNLNPTVR